MYILSASDVRNLLTMRDAIEVVQTAMVNVSAGKSILPLRTAVGVGGANKLGIMPGVLEENGVYGVKVLSLFPDNPAKGLSSHIGAMLLFDPETGAPSAVINADALTAIRTAAASAAATRALSRPDSRVLAIIGSGEQAETHIKAITAIRDIEEVRIAGRSKARAEEFIAPIASTYKDIRFIAAKDTRSAVAGADIVCTVTSSAEVVLQGGWVTPGTHVNAVGASLPVMQEIDQALVLKSSLFVDYRPSALAQAKEIIDGLASGAFTETHILGEIGEVYAGHINGRSNRDEITLYRSLGIAAQDLAVAEYVLNRADKTDVGTIANIL